MAIEASLLTGIAGRLSLTLFQVLADGISMTMTGLLKKIRGLKTNGIL